MLSILRKKTIESEYNQFIEQIKEISRLERDADKLYNFSLSLCEELYKHTGSHEWHEKLHRLINES